MRPTIMKLASVNMDGTALQLDNGLRLFVMHKDHTVASGWKAGDEVLVTDAPDQPRGYILRSTKANDQVVETLAR